MSTYGSDLSRVHYLLLKAVRRIYFIFVYGKDEIDTLSPVQKQTLRVMVERIKKEIAPHPRSAKPEVRS